MDKKKIYEELIPQISSLIDGETDETAVLSNIAAAIHYNLGFFWTGFYRVINNELLVGPFQGPTACYHIAYGKGVCGTAWMEQRTLVVPDVMQFKGHIACSSLSKSEIVVPVFNCQHEVVAVLDIDSTELATFDDIDRVNLEKISQLITNTLYCLKS